MKTTSRRIVQIAASLAAVIAWTGNVAAVDAAATNTPAAAPAAVPAGGMTDKEILTKADEARGNLKGVKWDIDIDAAENNKHDQSSLTVSSRGYDFLAIFQTPAKMKGQKVLFVERNMWYAKPGVKKPVPISARQKLVGGAAYGDIAATNYGEDYDPTRLPDETIDGTACNVFDLKANNKKSTYDKIKYWVAKDRCVAIKADYYTVSGKMFKTARFEFDRKVQVDGKDQPFISKIVITDALVSANVTSMVFSNPKLEQISDSTFDVNLLMSR